MNFSVLIITHNSSDTIEPCLAGLQKAFKSLIVIDNNSKDSTADIIRDKYPSIRLIRNKDNLGFAKAVNMGIKKSRGDVVLLNPDTKTSLKTLNALSGIARENENIAAVAPKTLNEDGSLQFNCGNFPTILNLALDRIRYIRDLTAKSYLIRSNSYYKSHQTPGWLSGSCLYIKRSVINKVGLFDERFFMYGEDVDWCRRAREAGYKVVYTPKTSITHYDQGKSNERYPNKFYNMRKGFLVFFSKYNKHFDLFVFKVLLRLHLKLKKTFGSNSKIWTETIEKLESSLNENFNSSAHPTQ